ncbi:HD domain protein [uncultured archaeon]|nr:HD domain protein [uncultured archaeon]
MKELNEFADEIYNKNLNDLKDREYVLADTRIKNVSLYDHQVLTAGIAVATVKELLIRGKSPEEICREKISEKDLISVIRIASLLHDRGKDHEEKYKNHQKRSAEHSKKLLEENGIEQPYFNLILSAVERHHLDFNPKTLHEKIVCLADSLASAGDRPELAKAKTREELLRVSRSNRELYNEVFEGKKGLAVFLGDVDRVHSYVFETSKLPEIRGGSELLNYLNNDCLKELFENELAKECLVYNGGGSFLAITPAKMADPIIKKIEKVYLGRSRIVTITCAKKEIDYLQFARGMPPYANEDIRNLKGEGIGNWLIESHFGKDQGKWFKKINGEECEICRKKGFGEIVAPLSIELRRKKDMKENIPFYEALPIGRRCNSCGKRVAVDKKVYEKTGEELWLCNICKIKREKDEDKDAGGKFYFRKYFRDFLNTKNVEVQDYYSKFPENLDELTEEYGSYYAFIYADGNNIGALLEEIKTPAQYRHFAEKLKIATENSVFEAIFETFGKEKIKKLEKLPFEIINIGGDDVTIITAKPFAFNLSKLLLEIFEKKTEKIAREFENENLPNLTMSLGMTICKAKYPVYYAEKISESLLKEAKKKAKEGKQLKSAVNYIYLKTDIASDSAKELLEMYFERKKAKVSLVMRPYILEDFDFIFKKAQEIRQEKLLSASQRKAFQQALAKGRWEAFNFIFYQIARMPEYKRGKLIDIIKELSNKFSCDDENYLWKLETDSDIMYSTPIYDLLELVEVGGESFE